MKIRQARKILKFYGYDFFMDYFTIRFLIHTTRHKISSLRKAKLASKRLSNKKINKKHENLFLKIKNIEMKMIAGVLQSMLEDSK